MKTFIISLFVVVATMSIKTKAQVKNVVLVHRAFADGFGYKKRVLIIYPTTRTYQALRWLRRGWYIASENITNLNWIR